MLQCNLFFLPEVYFTERPVGKVKVREMEEHGLVPGCSVWAVDLQGITVTIYHLRKNGANPVVGEAISDEPLLSVFSCKMKEIVA